MAKQVILQDNFPSLGYVGDVVSVKPGFARNYLIPRGIAVDASSANGKLLKHRMEGIQAKRAKLKATAEEYAAKLQEITLSFTLKLGEGGKTFGAITARDIEGAFKAHGHEIAKKQIRLYEPLKAAGSYKVDVKIHAEVMASVPVTIQSEAPKKAAKDADAVGGKGAGRKRSPKGSKEAKEEKTAKDESPDATDPDAAE